MEVATTISVSVDELEVMPYYKVIEQYQFAISKLKTK